MLQEEGWGSASGCDLDGSTPEGRAPMSYDVVFFPLCVPLHNLETDWAAECAEVMLAAMPCCEARFYHRHDSAASSG